MTEERLTELEIKMAYQEDLLQELNRIVALQQRELTRLGQTCQFLHEQVNNLQLEKRDDAMDPPPPHY